MNGRGRFEIVLGVPEDYDGHRCQYARDVLGSKLGGGLVDSLVIQRTIPVDPVDAEPGREYYEFGGNVSLARVDDAE